MAHTALVVDDERFFRTILGDYLTQHLQMRTILAPDGPTALSILETEKIDVVLLDILMPEMDGLTVLRKIRELSPDLPVVMVSVSSAVDHVITALREGANDFVRKPVDLDELAICIQRALGSETEAALPTPAPIIEAREAGPTSDADRRKAPRVRFRQPARALLQLRDVSLVDLSHTGALVEHVEPVRPGEIYRLAITVEREMLHVLARAIRVFASHRVTLTGGERQVVYRTGMEFVGLKKDAASLIARHVEKLLESGEPEAF
jgi:DNA-binding response OmpR family regulator